MVRSDYEYTVTDNIISIIDLDKGGRSVTNDMENVIQDLKAILGDLSGYAIIYKDSMGIWDGVRIDGRCIEFYSLNETQQEKAAQRLLHIIA